MYLDKKIANAVEIVQTLSRLNRTFPGKDQVFIIDFVNEPEVIEAAFAKYDCGAKITRVQDLNVIYDMKERLDEAVVPFLHDIGIPTGDIWVNRESAIQRLCDLTGRDLKQVHANMIHVLAWRSYSYRGHAFSAEFLNGPETKFCPACLAEDDDQGRRPALDRKGRTIWLFRPVRTCPKHKIALMTRPDVEWHHSFREMAFRVPERGPELASLVEAQPTRDTSPLQDYILSRFDGQAGPEWLDGQGVEQAVRATELVGVVIAFGTKPNLKLFTQEDWETAARAGFSFTARGEQGVRDALDLMFERFIGSGNCKTGWSGPQVVFGRLYQWLNFSKTRRTLVRSGMWSASIFLSVLTSSPERNFWARLSRPVVAILLAAFRWPPACTRRRSAISSSRKD